MNSINSITASKIKSKGFLKENQINEEDYVEYIDFNNFFHKDLEFKHVKLYNMMVAFSRNFHNYTAGHIIVGNDVLADKTNVSLSTVKRNLKVLEKAGFITIKTERRRFRRITINDWKLIDYEPQKNRLNNKGEIIHNNNNINNKTRFGGDFFFQNFPSGEDGGSFQNSLVKPENGQIVDFTGNYIESLDFKNFIPTQKEKGRQYIFTTKEIENFKKNNDRLEKIEKQCNELTDEINKFADVDFQDRPLAFVRGVFAKLKSRYDSGITRGKENLNMNTRKKEIKIKDLEFKNKWNKRADDLYSEYSEGVFKGGKIKARNQINIMLDNFEMNDEKWELLLAGTRKWISYWKETGKFGQEWQPFINTFLSKKQYEELPCFNNLPKTTINQKQKTVFETINNEQLISLSDHDLSKCKVLTEYFEHRICEARLMGVPVYYSKEETSSSAMTHAYKFFRCIKKDDSIEYILTGLDYAFDECIYKKEVLKFPQPAVVVEFYKQFVKINQANTDITANTNCEKVSMSVTEWKEKNKDKLFNQKKN